MTPEEERRRTAVAVAGLCFGSVASATYLLQRLYERLRGGGHDPYLILSEVRAHFYGRALVATWWAILIAFLVGRRLVISEREAQARRWAVAGLVVGFVALFWAWRFP